MREFFHNGGEIGYVIYTLELGNPWFYDGHGNWVAQPDHAKIFVLQADAMMVRNAMPRATKARIGKICE